MGRKGKAGKGKGDEFPDLPDVDSAPLQTPFETSEATEASTASERGAAGKKKGKQKGKGKKGRFDSDEEDEPIPMKNRKAGAVGAADAADDNDDEHADGSKAGSVVVAAIRSLRKHPKADKLRICEADTGEDRVQVITNAVDATVGMKVVLATVGATTPGSDLKIEQRAVKGVDSFGMFCSAYDLGWTSEADGKLLVVPKDVELGTVVGKQPVQQWLSSPVVEEEGVDNNEEEEEQAGHARPSSRSKAGGKSNAKGKFIQPEYDDDDDYQPPTSSRGGDKSLLLAALGMNGSEDEQEDDKPLKSKGGKKGKASSSAFAALEMEDDEEEDDEEEAAARGKEGQKGKRVKSGKAGGGQSAFAALGTDNDDDEEKDDDEEEEEAKKTRSSKKGKKGGKAGGSVNLLSAFSFLGLDEEGGDNDQVAKTTCKKSKGKGKNVSGAFAALGIEDDDEGEKSEEEEDISAQKGVAKPAPAQLVSKGGKKGKGAFAALEFDDEEREQEEEEDEEEEMEAVKGASGKKGSNKGAVGFAALAAEVESKDPTATPGKSKKGKKKGKGDALSSAFSALGLDIGEAQEDPDSDQALPSYSKGKKKTGKLMDSLFAALEGAEGEQLEDVEVEEGKEKVKKMSKDVGSLFAALEVGEEEDKQEGKGGDEEEAHEKKDKKKKKKKGQDLDSLFAALEGGAREGGSGEEDSQVKKESKKKKTKDLDGLFAALEGRQKEGEGDKPKDEDKPEPSNSKKKKKGKSKDKEDEEDINALLAQLDGPKQAPDTPQPSGSRGKSANTAEDNAELAALLAELDAPRAAPASSKKKMGKDKPKEDEDIDALLAELNGPKPVAEAPKPAEGESAGKGRKKKKGKVGADAKQEDEDIDALLASIDGPKAAAPTKALAPVPDLAFAPAPAAQAETDAKDEDDDVDGDEPVEGKELTAAQKKKLKKKQKEKEKKAAAAAPAVAVAEEEAASAAAKGKGKPVKESAAVRRMREQLEARKKAEEEARLAEEERKRQEEEELRRIETEEKRKAEERERKKAAQKAKREELKRQGKLLTGKAKEQAERLAAMRAQLLKQAEEKGIDLPLGEEAAVEEKKPKKVVYAKKKGPSKKKDEEEKKEEPAAIETEPATTEPAVLAEATPMEIEPAAAPAVLAAEAMPKPAPEPAAGDWEEAADDWEMLDEVELPLPGAPSAGKQLHEAVAEKGLAAKGAKAEAKANGKVEEVVANAAKAEESEVDEEEDEEDEDEDENGSEDEEEVSGEETESESEESSDDSEDSSDYDSSDEDSEDERDRRIDEARAKRLARAAKAREAALAAARRGENTRLRSPICCILGHVDVGKTKILDNIRRTNVQMGEAGGITQQIGATFVPNEAIEKRTSSLRAANSKAEDWKLKLPGLLVIDTPGHESFTNLRQRGSGLCDIAVLIVDLMHGLEQQTIESINMLRLRKTPFIIALNKVDRLYNWKSTADLPIRESLKRQKETVTREFEDRSQAVFLQLNEQGLNVALYWKNPDPKHYVNVVPTSAMSGEGIPDLMQLLVKLTQSRMQERLTFVPDTHCTVLEVKTLEGLGTTIDVILTNGALKVDDRIVVCGMQGPIVTRIKALKTPQVLKEMRVKGALVDHKEVLAAMGVKIVAPGLEHAVAGTQLHVVGPEDSEEELKDAVQQDMAEIFARIDKGGEGVYVQASTLGSLEALLAFLNSDEVGIQVFDMNIGPVHKRDVLRANVMNEKGVKKFAVILAFDVPVSKEAQELAQEFNVKIMTADVIYHLFDQFTAYMKQIKLQEQEAARLEAVFPCTLTIIPTCIFNKKDPIVLGVEITEGVAKVGTPICIPSRDGIDLGRIASMELNHKSVDVARAGQSVAMKIEGTNTEQSQRLFGRHFDHTDQLVSRITRESINALKAHFQEEMTKEDWRLVIKLKKVFNIT